MNKQLLWDVCLGNKTMDESTGTTLPKIETTTCHQGGGYLTYSTDKHLKEKAMDELNETPERYKQELKTIKNLVQSKYKAKINIASIN